MPKERSYKSNERKKANRRGLGAAFLPRPYHERTVWTPKNSLWFSGYAKPEEYSLTRGTALRRRPVTHPYFKLPQPIPSPPHFTTPSTGAGRQTPATYNAPLSKELLPLPKHPPPPRPPARPGRHRARRRRSPPLMAAAAPLTAAAGAHLRSGGGPRPAGSTTAAAAAPEPGGRLRPSRSVTGRLWGPRMRA